MRMRLLLSDGSRTSEGRLGTTGSGMGLEAVVVALFNAAARAR